ncbi:MAG: hypothetical protein ACRBFS_11560 [Aureispira sp.]
MHYTTIKTLLSLLALSTCLLLSSCGEGNPTEDQTDLPSQTDSTASNPEESTNDPANARNSSTDALSGTYIFKDQSSPEAGGTLAIQLLENGRLKFELDLINGPPNHHTGTATGEMELEGNSAVFTTSEYAMEGQQPCAISFLFIDNKVEIQQEEGSDMSCGFGQGVVARGIYTKNSDQPVFNYEGSN